MPINHDSILEAFRDLGTGVTQTLKNDVGKGMISDGFQSLFGQTPRSGEFTSNPFESFPFSPKEKGEMTQKPDILSPEKISEEERRTKQQLEAVRAELLLLAQSIGQLNQEVEKAIMETPVDPGVYHVHFFERLRRVLQMIRKRVNESREWLQLSYERKKRKGYWAMYKKHGTKFGLSADRTPSTQTG